MALYLQNYQTVTMLYLKEVNTMWDIFSILFEEKEQSWWNYLLTGLFFILAGIVIILVPQILVALVASVLIVIGLVIVFFAWQLRNIHRSHRKIRIEYLD